MSPSDALAGLLVACGADAFGAIATPFTSLVDELLELGAPVALAAIPIMMRVAPTSNAIRKNSLWETARRRLHTRGQQQDSSLDESWASFDATERKKLASADVKFAAISLDTHTGHRASAHRCAP
jgi:hypothetical protein